ncbi:MAG: glyoxalase [Lachnospiraceae bacterium]|nr:glyoxalase [Lachnospiraceae bacterium]
MPMFDEKVLDCFLENQLQLYPEEVVTNREEAEEFLEDAMAVVLESEEEVEAYFEEVGIDCDGNILDAEEVFDIGDGRYLVLEV